MVARQVFPEVIDRLAQSFIVDHNACDEPLSREQLKDRLADKHGLMSAVSDAIDADVIAAAPSLRAVCNFAVGYNNVDVSACNRAGIMVTNTPDVLNEATADFTWALILAVARRIGAAERWTRNGNWDRWKFIQWLGADVHNATMGIVGFGRIGKAVARRARGFSMRVIYHNRHRLTEGIEIDHGVEWASLATLLQQSDFVVLLVPYSSDTHHLIGKSELELMKPGAHLINMARGGVVDDAALVDVLRHGRIAGAALDVFEGEPRFNPGFLGLDNVVMTPHIGSSTRATRMAMAMRAAENLELALSGQRPRDLINAEVFPK